MHKNIAPGSNYNPKFKKEINLILLNESNSIFNLSFKIFQIDIF